MATVVYCEEEKQIFVMDEVTYRKDFYRLRVVYLGNSRHFQRVILLPQYGGGQGGSKPTWGNSRLFIKLLPLLTVLASAKKYCYLLFNCKTQKKY